MGRKIKILMGTHFLIGGTAVDRTVRSQVGNGSDSGLTITVGDINGVVPYYVGGLESVCQTLLQ